MRKLLAGFLFVLMLAVTAYCASAAPSISVSPSSLTFSGDFGVTVNKTLTITNTGTTNVTVGFSKDSLDGFDFTYSSQNFVLHPGQNQTVTIRLTLPEDNPVKYNGTIIVGDSSVTKNVPVLIDLTTAKTLVIKSLEINGDSTNNDGTFNDLVPLDTVKFDMNIKNNLANEDDTIESIVATVTIYNIDNQGDDDIELESDEIELDGDGDDQDVDVSFEVPYDIKDNKEYKVKIVLEGDGSGDNNDGDSYKVEWTVYLKGNKDKNTLKIMDFSADPEEVICGTESVKFSVDAADIGSNDQSKSVVKITSSALGIAYASSRFDMDSDPDKDDFEATKSLTWDVPANVKAGTYTVDAYLYFDDDKETDHKTVSLKIGSCEETAAQPATNKTSTGTQTTGYQSGTTTIQPGISYSAEQEKSSLKDSPLYMVALIAVIVAALVLIVFLIVKMVKG